MSIPDKILQEPTSDWGGPWTAKKLRLFPNMSQHTLPL